MKKSKEHQKFSFENWLKNKIRQFKSFFSRYAAKRLEQVSNVDEHRLRNACQLAGVPYVGENEAVDELRQYTYKRLNKLREELEAQQEELNAQLRGLARRVEAIGISLQLIERAEEAKLKEDIERLKADGGDTEGLEKELQERSD